MDIYNLTRDSSISTVRSKAICALHTLFARTLTPILAAKSVPTVEVALSSLITDLEFRRRELERIFAFPPIRTAKRARVLLGQETLTKPIVNVDAAVEILDYIFETEENDYKKLLAENECDVIEEHVYYKAHKALGYAIPRYEFGSLLVSSEEIGGRDGDA